MKLTEIRPFDSLGDPRVVAALVKLASSRIDLLDNFGGGREDGRFHDIWGLEHPERRPRVQPCGCENCAMVRIIWPTREDWQLARGLV